MRSLISKVRKPLAQMVLMLCSFINIGGLWGSRLVGTYRTVSIIIKFRRRLIKPTLF